MSSGWLSKAVAEAIGPFFLTFIGVGSIVAAQASGASNLVGIALAHGLALGIAVYATANVSGGHLNPSITFSMWLTKRISTGLAALYIASQLIGATIAALLIKAFFPAAAVAAVKLGATLPGQGISAGAALGIEIVLTFFLAFVIYNTAVDDRAPKGIYGFAIGLTVMFDILAGGPFSGASMNPSRSFGPALVGGYWDVWWVYWLGPFIGASIAALLYDGVMRERQG